MSNRLFYALLCVTSLLVGGVMYLLFRENTYVSLLFKENVTLERAREFTEALENDFLKFYLPDFLWSFSLCFGLLFIFKPRLSGCIVCCIGSFVYGISWEILQFCGIMSGTGDGLDMLMYLTASIVAVVICIKRRNKNEKNC